MKKILVFATLLISLGSFSQSPVFPDIEGWSRWNAPVRYNADSLWSIIDGAAEGFLRYNFIEMQRMEYIRLSDSAYIEVHAYQHRDPLNAFGIYSQERPSSLNLVNIGDQGYKEDGMLNFLTKNYYIKMLSSATDEAALKSLCDIAEILTTSIGKAGSLPAELNLFPAENKVSNSEQLIAADFLGYSFLSQVFRATYSKSGKEYYMFIVKKENAAQVEDILKSLYKSINKTYKPNEQNLYEVKDPNNGLIFLLQKGSVLYGLVNTKDKSSLKMILN